MKKIDAVLVVLNRETLENVVKNLNFDSANLVAIIADNDNEKSFTIGKNQIPMFSFVQIKQAVKKYKGAVWLIGGRLNDSEDLNKAKKFLAASDVPEKNIVNFEVSSQVSETYLANVKHVSEHGASFFATGNEYMRNSLNLKLIPRVYGDKKLDGANLSDAKQDLRQSFLTAKYIFEHVKPSNVKFVLIGLTPDIFYCDNGEENLQHLLTFTTVSSKQADLNFNAVKDTLNQTFSAKATVDWDCDTKTLTPADVDKNFQILKDYIELCLTNGAKPVGVIFPVAPAMRKIYNSELLNQFREKIRSLEESCYFKCVDMFELNLGYDSFCDMTHLNKTGMIFANACISLKLFKLNLIPAESFCDMTYDYFYKLSNTAPKDEYHALMGHVFNASAEMIRRKDKIKIGFVAIDSAQWCGNELYNLFVNNPRFETTLFDCLRMDRAGNALIKEDFVRGIEQFKQQGLNVVALDNRNAKVSAQDVIIFLSPYFEMLPNVLRHNNLTVKTLITHIPYSFSISIRSDGFYNRAMFHTAWKLFLSSSIALKVFDKKSTIGLPRGLFSGYPRTDIFFGKSTETLKQRFHFDWKMARPKAKKIIYAPHWSINGVTRYATFQWNYEFMYEFAKAHPEISWVVKPHQALFFSAVNEKVFPTLEAFKEYLQKWDDLPNAQVYTGAYYHSIFATSDGMIHDSGSFIAEYQFVNKPMIFLTREKEKFNDLGKTILEASYTVDGKDLEGIAALMQKVFIEGDDYKAAERQAVFNKYLNYPKANGMLASEFIYRSIADELTEESK